MAGNIIDDVAALTPEGLTEARHLATPTDSDSARA